MDIIIFILLINMFVTPLRQGIFKFIRQVLSRRVQVKAVLVSKVDSKFEDKMPLGMMMGDRGRIHGHSEAVKEAHWLRKAIPVKILIFDVAGKNIEFPVEKEIFDRYNENDVGVLDYKGHKLYDYKVVKATNLKERLADSMTDYEYTTWLAKRRSVDCICHYLRNILVVSLLLAFCILRVVAISESYKMHQDLEAKCKKVEIPLEKLSTELRREILFYNEVVDGRVVFYVDASLVAGRVAVIKTWFWPVVFIFYGILITILVVSLLYFIIRLIRAIIARYQLLKNSDKV